MPIWLNVLWNIALLARLDGTYGSGLQAERVLEECSVIFFGNILTPIRMVAPGKGWATIYHNLPDFDLLGLLIIKLMKYFYNPTYLIYII